MAKSFNEQMKDRFIKISSDYDTINAYVHETAVMILKHAKEHGDCSTAQGLVMAMPASARREMLILWFKSFSPIVVKNDGAWTAKMHPKDSKLYVPFDVEGGEATPFYKLAEKHKERPPLDFKALRKMVEGLADRIEKMVAEGKVQEDDVPSAEAIVKQLSGLNIRRIRPAPAANTDTPSEDTEAEDVIQLHAIG